jgi:hypothetical protein
MSGLSEIEISNLALDRLGSSTIISFQETIEGKLCGRNYPIARDFILRQHPWNFTVKRVKLTRSVKTPVFGFLNQFRLPDDLIRILEVNEDYRLENGYLLSDKTTLEVKYSAVVGSNLFDVSFASLISIYLAYLMCETLTQDTAKKSKLYQEFKIELMDAKRKDAQENKTTAYRGLGWLGER